VAITEKGHPLYISAVIASCLAITQFAKKVGKCRYISYPPLSY